MFLINILIKLNIFELHLINNFRFICITLHQNRILMPGSSTITKGLLSLIGIIIASIHISLVVSHLRCATKRSTKISSNSYIWILLQTAPTQILWYLRSHLLLSSPRPHSSLTNSSSKSFLLLSTPWSLTKISFLSTHTKHHCINIGITINFGHISATNYWSSLWMRHTQNTTTCPRTTQISRLVHLSPWIGITTIICISWTYWFE